MGGIRNVYKISMDDVKGKVREIMFEIRGGMDSSGSFEHANELSDSIKRGEFLD
jgi:hypothetical protein